MFQRPFQSLSSDFVRKATKSFFLLTNLLHTTYVERNKGPFFLTSTKWPQHVFYFIDLVMSNIDYLFWFLYMHSTCSFLVLTYWTCNSMNNLSSFCGLVAARINASGKYFTLLRLLSFQTKWQTIFGLSILHNGWMQWP